MTFVVDWALKTNYLPVYLAVQNVEKLFKVKSVCEGLNPYRMCVSLASYETAESFAIKLCRPIPGSILLPDRLQRKLTLC